MNQVIEISKINVVSIGAHPSFNDPENFGRKRMNLPSSEIRKLIADNSVSDHSELYRLLYDEVDIYGSGHIAEVILLIAKYEQSDSQVVDKEINAIAMLIEILQEIR